MFNLKPKTTRTRNGQRQALFGGYAFWFDRSGNYRTREVRVWGPAGVDETDCGHGADTIMDLLQAKASKLTKRDIEVREMWRY